MRFSILFGVFFAVFVSASEVKVVPFQAGDKAVVLGDSITNIGMYPAMFQALLALRDPAAKVEVYNAGVGGNTAWNGIMRYPYDVVRRAPKKVFIMFGMNDVGRHCYKENQSEKDRKTAEWFVKNYASNMEKLVALAKKSGIEVILMTPSPYDENGTTSKKKSGPGINSVGLTKLAAFVREIGARENLAVIDLHAPITALQNAHPELAFSGSDRVHPQDFGALALAAQMAKGCGLGDAPFAEIAIDAASGRSETRNAGVSELKSSASAVSFLYTPKALPMAKDKNYESLDPLMDLSGTLNREILKIGGLSAGNYMLRADGREIGRFSAEEFAKGVNIAVLDTPSQRSAKDVWQKLGGLKMAAQTGCAMSGARQRVLGEKGDPDKLDSANAAFEKRIAKERNEKGKARERGQQQFFNKNFGKDAELDAGYLSKINGLYEVAKLVPFRVSIER